MSGLECNLPESMLMTSNMPMLLTFPGGKLELDLVADYLSKILESMLEQLGNPHSLNIVPTPEDAEYYIAVSLE